MTETIIRNTFRKDERICNQKQIDLIFSGGKALTAGNFRIIHLKNPSNESAHLMVLMAVPKRNIRKAVFRNRMKRLMREAFRVQKHTLSLLLQQKDIHIGIAIVFNGKMIVSQQETNLAINELLDRLIKYYEKDSE